MVRWQERLSVSDARRNAAVCGWRWPSWSHWLYVAHLMVAGVVCVAVVVVVFWHFLAWLQFVWHVSLKIRVANLHLFLLLFGIFLVFLLFYVWIMYVLFIL